MPERPRVTVKVKFARGEASDEQHGELAQDALGQIEIRGYGAEPLPEAASGRLRGGITFCGKCAAVLSVKA